jgi:thioredoxin 2
LEIVLRAGDLTAFPPKHLSDVGKCGACKAELPAIGEPIEVNEEQFNDIIRESKVPVLTDFWRPCADRAVWPRLTWYKPPETSLAWSGREGHTEWFPSLTAQYNVRSMPNFAVFSRDHALQNAVFVS